ncbi:PaaI family thioesterase [Reyranella soli]|uniref:Putative esterase n=1 Tax=Reyranella soli TaxID=1230389 RepID=A0A512NRW8_9HYPH|nr:PaaI family thioesterase [Reyranella soli]GEP61683.1 putative esterase [Reyranella soli]
MAIPSKVPLGFRELTEASGFAAANGPWFEKIDGDRVIRGFLPGPQHANALGIVHGGMLAAFIDSAMGTAVLHTLNRRAVTVRMSLDYLGPGRVGDWLQAEGEVVGHDEHMAQVRGRLYGPRHEVLAGLGVFSLLSRHRKLTRRG